MWDFNILILLQSSGRYTILSEAKPKTRSALQKLCHRVLSTLCSVLHPRQAVIWDAPQRFALLWENGGQNARRDAEGQLKGIFLIIVHQSDSNCVTVRQRVALKTTTGPSVGTQLANTGLLANQLNYGVVNS